MLFKSDEDSMTGSRGIPRVGITAATHSLPDRVVSTDELQSQIDAASELQLPAGLLSSATGIVSRRVVREGFGRNRNPRPTWGWDETFWPAERMIGDL